MAKPKPRHHVHLVEWRDAYSLGTWTKPDDMKPEPTIPSPSGSSSTTPYPDTSRWRAATTARATLPTASTSHAT